MASKSKSKVERNSTPAVNAVSGSVSGASMFAGAVARPAAAKAAVKAASAVRANVASTALTTAPVIAEKRSGMTPQQLSDWSLRMEPRGAATARPDPAKPVTPDARPDEPVRVVRNSSLRLGDIRATPPTVVRTEEKQRERERDVVCKKRPESNRPRRGGGGGSKRFIPWC
jgi:hypothetical protein